MARILTDSDVALDDSERWQLMGHDGLTTADVGIANMRITDSQVLRTATDLGLIVVTMNRRDYRRLHSSGVRHCGIVLVSRNRPETIAARVHRILVGIQQFDDRCFNARADRSEEIFR